MNSTNSTRCNWNWKSLFVMVLTQGIHKLQAPFLRMTSYGDSKDFCGGLLQEKKILFQRNTT